MGFLTSFAPTPLALDKFIAAALEADWACYAAAADRADLARMTSVITAFPHGFKVYYLDGSTVGYTGWYPIAEDVFDRLDNDPGGIRHRGFMKPVPVSDYIYLFNYSVVPTLIGTEHGRTIVKDYAKVISELDKRGMAAVTVSPHGARVAEKFGMALSGQMTHDGDIEKVYTVRL